MITLRKGFRPKRWVIVTVGILIAIVLLAAGYGAWSVSSWNAYRDSYQGMRDELKPQVDDALALPSASVKERTKKLESLQEAMTAVAARATPTFCSVNTVIGWQQGLNASYRQWHKDCESTVAAIRELNDTLRSAAAYLSQEHELAGILTTAMAATNKKVAEASFGTVRAKWQAAVTATGKIDATEEFSPVKRKAQSAIGNVAKAWNSLVAAHSAKDEAKYTAAVSSLSAAYSALDDIKAESTKDFAAISKTMQDRYERAF